MDRYLHNISAKFTILLLLIVFTSTLYAQENILSSYQSFSSGTVKIGSALDIISRTTGYYFTYDSKLIDSEIKITLDVTNKPLNEILREILDKDSLRFSVIGSHIIISKLHSESLRMINDSTSSERIMISGIIVDHETEEPLPFATVTISGKPKGTTSNIDGFFSINIDGGTIGDTLTFSYLGFLNRYIPVAESFGNDFTIKMRRDYIPIPEIIIRSQVPLEIIRKFKLSVPLNYGTTPASMWGFYREGIIKGKEIQIYSEAVLHLYKSAYNSLLQNDQVRVIRSRKTENINITDTLMLRLKAGLSGSLQLDIVRNTVGFLDEEQSQLYDYYMTDIVTIGDETAYVIEFKQKDFTNEPLFTGSIMVNTVDYGLMQAEFEVSPEYINRSSGAFVTSPRRGYQISPDWVRYRVGFRKTGDRYFLSHVRGDLRFSVRKKRRIFSSKYDVFFELAITQTDTHNITRFGKSEIIPLESVFSRTVKGYDPEFWGSFDFLSPEEDLIKSLNSITQKLSRYIEEEK